MKKQQKRKKRSLTLIEMIVVMLLIAMITGALAYNYNSSLNKGRAFKSREGITRIETILSIALVEDSSNTTDKVVSNWREIVKRSPLAGKGDELCKDGWNHEYTVRWEKRPGSDEEGFVVESPGLKAYDKK